MAGRLTHVAILGACVASLLAVPSNPSDAQEVTDPAALAVVMPRPSLAGQSIYFVMTDRYANGSTANDRGGLERHGFDPTGRGWFHGGDFVGLTASLDRIQRLGFTALWITPPFVQQAVQGDSAAYHGYWGLDFTTVDPHFGTEEEFRALVDAVHARGMRIYLDVVVNHTADVNRYRDGSSFVRAPNVKDAYIPDGAPVRTPAWLNDLSSYSNRGESSSCGWSGDDCLQNGDFYGLDDLATTNPTVLNGWIEVYSDWVRRYRLDGMRIDTAKHVDPAFLPAWGRAVAKAADEAGVKDFSMFGEFWLDDPRALSAMWRRSRLESALDFPAQRAVVNFAARTGEAQSLRAFLATDDLYNVTDPDGVPRNAYGLVTFGGNHDMGRIGLRVAAAYYQPSASVLLQRVRLAHTVLFLMRGVPTVYYGDEVGMMGTGGDKDARQDMFPTRVSIWRTEERIGGRPIGSASSLTAEAEKHPLSSWIRRLNALRRDHGALRSGSMIMRTASGSTAAWSRIDATERREYLVVANSGNTTRTIRIPTSSPRTRFTAVLGAQSARTASSTGILTVTVAPRSAVVLRAGSLLPVDAALPGVTAAVGATDATSDTTVLSATVGSTLDPVSVTFVMRTADGQWQRLGTDDAPPFRLYADRRFLVGAPPAEVVAIVRTSDGRTRSSAPVTWQP